MVLGVVRDTEPTMGASLAIFPVDSSTCRSDSQLAPARGPLRAGFLFRTFRVFFCVNSIDFYIHLLRASIGAQFFLATDDPS